MPSELLRKDVQTLMREGAQVVEVLEAPQYREAHLPGAMHIHLRNLAEQAAARATGDRVLL